MQYKKAPSFCIHALNFVIFHKNPFDSKRCFCHILTF